MIRTSNKNLAKKHCANYGKGQQEAICAGLMIGKNGAFWKNEEYAGKECFADEKCDYFETVVFPGISSNGV
tara:strand:- start:313 stop:525 length:213 start_codon:yes stop_codon:yes gene_type:complete